MDDGFTFLDIILAGIVALIGAFYLVASLFPSTGYVLATWVFLFYFIIAGLLFIDRSINDSSAYFLRTLLYMMILYSVIYSFSQIWWAGLLGIPLAVYLNGRYPIQRNFISAFLWGFWVLHFFLVFINEMDFLHAVTYESLFKTVVSWKVIIIVAFAAVISKVFEEDDDDVKENTKYAEKQEEMKKQMKKQMKDKMQNQLIEEIIDGTKKLFITDDPIEKERLRKYILVRKEKVRDFY